MSTYEVFVISHGTDYHWIPKNHTSVQNHGE